MNNFITGWYVIYTKPKHEKKVAARLAHAGITCFLPLVKDLRTWHDRKKYIEAPLFPSYIFIHLRTKLDYFAGLAADGVWYYVREGKNIARVSDKTIADLKMVISGDAEIDVSYEYFHPGRQLAIAEGPLCGLSCEIVEYKGKKGFLVRVNLLQRNVLISLPSEYLMAIPA